MLGELPVELVSLVLPFLPPQALARCEQVCSFWRWLALTSGAWRECLARDFPVQLPHLSSRVQQSSTTNMGFQVDDRLARRLLVP